MANPNGLLIVPVGFRADGSIHALELDNSDRLKVVIDSITSDLSITQTDASKLLAGINGWNGSAWRKLLVDGSDRLKVLIDAITSDVSITQTDPTKLFVTLAGVKKASRGSGIATQQSNTSLPAGVSDLNDSNVPANHTYIVRNISCYYTGTITGVILYPKLVIGGTEYNIATAKPAFSGEIANFIMDFPLSAGDHVRLTVTGATLNDDAYLWTFYEDLT